MKQVTKSRQMQLKLDAHKELQYLLFRRGFLISQNALNNMDSFPFYGNWNWQIAEGWHFYTHKDTYCHIVKGDKCTMWLIGHCYNPFTMEWDEKKQLAHIADAYGTDKFQDRIDELTGVFVMGWIVEKTIHFQADPSGMYGAWYGEMPDGNFMMSSHTQLFDDVYGLEMTDFVKELINYRWYHRVMGPYMPGDISPYNCVKRIVVNIDFEYTPGKGVKHHRFYPVRDIKMTKNDKEYNDVIRYSADILKRNAELLLKKWDKPGISLTGGIDSNTTFAACNGYYDKYATFSYQSAPKEVPDVVAAQKIANHFQTKHTIYQIPDNDRDIKDFEVKAAILTHNDGYIAPQCPNEVRKRCYLEEHCDIDVEVKSWVSETIRAYWYKHYNRTSMPDLSPKLFRNLYKIFLGNRCMAHKIDKIFADYINKYEYKEAVANGYLPADLHYNEVTWGSWGGLNITEMRYCFDITFLYNNRKFLDSLLRVPLKMRISDEHHVDMKKYLNKELYDMNIRVVNMKETNTRANLLNLIFTLNMWLPF